MTERTAAALPIRADLFHFFLRAEKAQIAPGRHNPKLF